MKLREQIVDWWLKVSGLERERLVLIEKCLDQIDIVDPSPYLLGYLHGLANQSETVAQRINNALQAKKLARTYLATDQAILGSSDTIAQVVPSTRKRNAQGRFVK